MSVVGEGSSPCQYAFRMPSGAPRNRSIRDAKPLTAHGGIELTTSPPTGNHASQAPLSTRSLDQVACVWKKPGLDPRPLIANRSTWPGVRESAVTFVVRYETAAGLTGSK